MHLPSPGKYCGCFPPVRNVSGARFIYAGRVHSTVFNHQFAIYIMENCMCVLLHSGLLFRPTEYFFSKLDFLASHLWQGSLGVLHQEEISNISALQVRWLIPAAKTIKTRVGGPIIPAAMAGYDCNCSREDCEIHEMPETQWFEHVQRMEYTKNVYEKFESKDLCQQEERKTTSQMAILCVGYLRTMRVTGWGTKVIDRIAWKRIVKRAKDYPWL